VVRAARKIATSLAFLNRPVTISGVDIRKITIVAVVVAAVCLVALSVLLERTTIGLHMRASSMDFQTARLLGVRANRVIGVAVLLSGALAAVVAVILTRADPARHSRLALRDTIIVLAGVVLGGLNRPIPATLGGFAIGFATGLLGGALPTNQSQYIPSFVFGAVILVLLVRPGGCSRAGAPWSAYETRCRTAGAARTGTARDRRRPARRGRLDVERVLLHRRTRQGGDRDRAFTSSSATPASSRSGTSASSGRSLDAGVLSVPATEKPAIMPNLAHALRDRTTGNLTSLVLACAGRGICALVVGLPLMRLSGLAAGIATFGVLEITHNLLRYEEKVGPGLNTFSSVPETTTLRQAALGALVVIVVAYAYARSRFGRLLRATREDAAAARAVGASVYRQRLVAFTLSGLLAGLAGGLYVHLLPVNTESVYLDLTFITLAMLVVGGATSLWGAVVGALAVSALDSYLAVAENGTSLFGWQIDLPAGRV